MDVHDLVESTQKHEESFRYIERTEELETREAEREY